MTPLRIAVTGASGLLGRTLTSHLYTEGHTIIPLVRGVAGIGEVRWDPAGPWDPSPLEGVDGVVHLAGEGIGDARWTADRKARIASSRIAGTRSLVQGLASLRTAPRVLVSASAMGIYGDRGAVTLEESAPLGRDWLSGVATAWEAEAAKATEFGSRTVITRFGLLLSPEGGVLGKMLTPFKLGVGGRLGDGHQWMSWITVSDTARVITAALTDPRYQGAINVATPAPVQNQEFTAILGRVLRRPAIAPVPAFVLRALFGEMADAAILASQRMVPARLQALGFTWQYPELEGALRALLGR